MGAKPSTASRGGEGKEADSGLVKTREYRVLPLGSLGGAQSIDSKNGYLIMQFGPEAITFHASSGVRVCSTKFRVCSAAERCLLHRLLSKRLRTMRSCVGGIMKRPFSSDCMRQKQSTYRPWSWQLER